MADNDDLNLNPEDMFPTEEQPMGSEDPTQMGMGGEGVPAPGDPNETQADFADPGQFPEPGTEAEGVEEATSEVTQEAPLLEDLPEPVDNIPHVPAVPLDVKPRSDLYTLILVMTFVAFCAVIGLQGNEAYEHYDVQFWMFSKLEKPPQEEGAEGEGGEEAPPPADGTGQ